MTAAEQPDRDIRDAVEKLFLRLKTLLETKAITDRVNVANGELPDSWAAALTSLANVIDKALRSKSDAGSGRLVLAALADASREIALRRPFGPSSQATEGASGPTCILDVTLGIIDTGYGPESVICDALRLIGNCCADEGDNRRYVVRNGGLSKMLALPMLRAVADFVVPAIYNVCIDFEDALEGSVQECSESSKKVNAAEVQLSSSRGSSNQTSIETLLELSSSVKDDRKTFLADLVEMASSPAAQHLNCLLGQSPAAENSEVQPYTDNALKIVLRSLVISPGPELAAHSSECCVSVCNAVMNVLSQDAARKALLALDELLPFTKMPYCFHDSDDPDADDDEDSAEDLRQCRKAYLKLIYELTSMKQFQERFTLKSTQIQSCISALRERSSFSEYLCVILANITTSIPTAEALVSEHKIHKVIIGLLYGPDENVLPAISLLAKLALPDANKTILVACGTFEVLITALKSQRSIVVQKEVVVAIRLLIKGRLDIVIFMRSRTSSVEEDVQLLMTIMNIYSKSSDKSLKLEIGRLFIEVCRTSLKASDTDVQFDQSFGGNSEFAHAISFVALNGQGGARSEGWFGLAMLSVMEQGRTMVLHALEDRELRTEMRKIATEHQGPSFENLRLMIAKLHPLPVRVEDIPSWPSVDKIA